MNSRVGHKIEVVLKKKGDQDVKSGKILSPSTPWTERGVPGIQVPDEQTSLKDRKSVV